MVAALDAPAGIYNVVDDEPLTRRDHFDALAAALGVERAPRSAPAVARKVGGGKTELLARSQRVIERAVQGRRPDGRRVPERPRGLAGRRGRDRRAGSEQMRDRVVRVLLVLLAASSGLIGLWAAFAPRSFYDDFPGGGRHWVAADGPYNEHLVRDVGGLYVAMTVVAIVAAIVLRRGRSSGLPPWRRWRSRSPTSRTTPRTPAPTRRATRRRCSSRWDWPWCCPSSFLSWSAVLRTVNYDKNGGQSG